jgi:FkbM family methyltransferase
VIKSTISRTVQKIAPSYCKRRFWKRRLCAMREYYHEQELHLVPLLCEKNKTSIDIGAHDGIYTIHMLDASRDCLAFEPCSSGLRALTEMVRYLSLPVHVEAVALSDTQGEASLRILERDRGRSTIEPDNTLEDPDGSERSEVTVQTRRLDDYNLDAVGFIKIDVEGHELSVLRGGSATIERCLPILLIEIEERHKPNVIHDIHGFLANLGYEGYFILNKNLVGLSSFDLIIHQNVQHIGGWKTDWRRSGVYVNNFFFVPAGGRSRLEAAVDNVRGHLSDVFAANAIQ